LNTIVKIQANKWSMVVLLIWLGFSACAGHPEPHEIEPDTGQSSLDFWLEKSLTPYLLQQFDQHPRFRGQPVLLVRMQGENVMPHIDDLTEQIRQKITDALLKRPGLDLAWRPSFKPWKHYQSLEDVSCGDYNEVRYYVGLDIGLSGESRELYVKVRALNLAEQKWVSGFGKNWQATPTRNQLEALTREHPDEYLRGLRPLPFSDRQPDMLAAYLARNLSCLLRQGQADDLVVHVDSPGPGTPDMFKTTLQLLGKYLARFSEVEVTDDPNQANVTVVSAIHSIDRNLHQIWISARQRQGEKYLPGAETEAYVMTNPPRDILTAGMNRVIPPETLAPFHNVSTKSGIIGSFDLLTPLDQKFCATEKPWRSGIQRLYPQESLPAGSCVAVEMDITTPAYVFLVGQDARGELTRIFPSSCPALAKIDARLQPGELFQFPSLSDPQAGVLELGGSPGIERIYAIAVTTPELAATFAGRIEEIQGLCRPGRKFPAMLPANSLQHPRERIQHWQNYLERLSKKYPGQLGWREFSFRHIAVRGRVTEVFEVGSRNAEVGRTKRATRNTQPVTWHTQHVTRHTQPVTRHTQLEP